MPLTYSSCKMNHYRLSSGRGDKPVLLFGHTGITLAAAVLLNRTLPQSHNLPTRTYELRGKSPLSHQKPYPQNRSSRVISWLTSLADRIDIRLLLIGSLLPDLIDKPIAWFFFRETFSNDRIFSHTLIFLIVIALSGLYLYWNRNKTWLLVLSFGTLTHLILDAMWRTPRTLLWPLYGFSFVRYDLAAFNLSSLIQGIFHTLLTYPAICIPELVGLAVVIWFAWLLTRRRTLYAFIRHGRV